MTNAPQRPAPRPVPDGAPDGGADRLRARIDSGATGDKVDYPDPAAAPLGTDDEAGGVPLIPESAMLAEQQELAQGRRADTPRPGDPLHPGPAARTNTPIYVGLAIVVLLVVVSLLW